LTFCQDRGIRDTITCNMRYLDIGIAQEPHARLVAPHLAAARDQAPNEDYARGCRKLHASMAERRPQANRTLAVLSAVWSWAARHRHVDVASNPTKVVEKYRESARERYLTKDELSASATRSQPRRRPACPTPSTSRIPKRSTLQSPRIGVVSSTAIQSQRFAC
jgi:hypothetical protein